LDGEVEEFVIGCFVLLYDLFVFGLWDGIFCVVMFVCVDFEFELGVDFMLGEVGWLWLFELFDYCGVVYMYEGGIVMCVVFESFVVLVDWFFGVEFEMSVRMMVILVG